jgi:hypothetical protein
MSANVSGARSVFFGGGKKKAPYFKIRVAADYSEDPKHLITPAALSYVKSSIGRPAVRLDRQGVETATGRVELPLLRVEDLDWNASEPNRIFCAPEEIRRIWTHFRLPSEWASSTVLFSLKTGQKTQTTIKYIMPVWDLLIDPAWVGSFMRWMADPNREGLPQPDSIPWRTVNCRKLTLPGLWQTFQIGSQIKSGLSFRGTLRVMVRGGEAHMIFAYNDRKSRVCFLLGDERARRINVDEGEDNPYIHARFCELFGRKPQRSEYAFQKRANDRGEMLIGNVQGNRLYCSLFNDKNGFSPGTVYYFRAERKSDWLYLYCYSRPDYSPEACIGEGIIPLHSGFPATDCANIHKC